MLAFLSPKIFFSTVAITLLIYSNTQAQSTQKFAFELPENKVSNSLYNKISVLDTRMDTTNMGIIQTGAFNKKTKVIAKEPLNIQFKNILTALTDSTAKPQELLIQLRQLSFVEITGSFSEKGYFYLRAGIYAKQPDGYRQVGAIDTVSLTTSGVDVTGALLKHGSETIAGFIAANLNKAPVTATTYKYTDLVKIDSVEKRNLKVYNTNRYTDGLYLTYKSFCNQVPDAPLVVTNNFIDYTMKTPGEKGKLKKVKSDKVYAVVYQGQAYIATKYDYYPLKKTNDDFFFTGKASATPSTVSMVTAGVFFGMLGSLIASNAEATFEMKIDHINGEFIRIKEIIDPNAGKYDYN